MNIDLTQEQKDELLYQFRLAAIHRAAQWDAERAMEKIVGAELDIDVAHWAFSVDDPNIAGAGDHITIEDLITELESQ